MSAPTLFLGARGGTPALTGAVVYRTDPEALDDAGTPFPDLARYAALYPAGGPDGEVVIYNLYAALRYTGALTLRFTPIVDGRALAEAAYEAVLPDRGPDAAVSLEIPLTLPYRVGGTVWSRYAPRGGTVTVEVERVGAAVGRYRLDGVVVELEVVRESLRPA